MGRSGAPDDLSLAPVTQAWIAVSDDPAATVTGGYFYRAGMSKHSPQSVASTYFSAWTSNDIEQVRPLLHPDVTFAGALGSTQGVEDTLAGLKGMFAIARIRVTFDPRPLLT